MHVFLDKSSIPDVPSWQGTIDSFGIPLVLDPQVNPLTIDGFYPSKMGGVESGFEISSGPAAEVLQDYSEMSDTVGDRDWCLSFRWGTDKREGACVLTASAALVKACNAIAYSPDDDVIYKLNELIEDAKSSIS
jgi:hypothetical protein